jgi:hypothetical protein
MTKQFDPEQPQSSWTHDAHAGPCAELQSVTAHVSATTMHIAGVPPSSGRFMLGWHSCPEPQLISSHVIEPDSELPASTWAGSPPQAAIARNPSKCDTHVANGRRMAIIPSHEADRVPPQP